MNSSNRIRSLLDRREILIVPGCHDAFSARLIELAGFSATFMGGFAVSASRLALPDTGLISYGEMVSQGRNICDAVNIPVFGDGDTGYGNAMNVKRTVNGYARAGFGCIMIEDQLFPKRCGHTRGKRTVDRDEAFARVRAAVDARDEGAGILIMARTDANGTEGLSEAIYRARTFHDLGADITFLEAPRNQKEMETYCEQVPGPKMANMVENGVTPILPPEQLQNIGYKIVAYPLTVLLSTITAVQDALEEIKNGKPPQGLAKFSRLRQILGFDVYDREENKYSVGNG